MKGKFSLIAALLLLCVCSMRAAIILPPQGGGGGGGGNNNTNGYSFNGPFTVVNATNVYLHAAISNLVGAPVTDYATNRFLLPTIFTNIVYVNARGANQADNGLLLTNALALAPAFCKIEVGPGDYFISEVAVPSPAFAIDNRWIFFHEGANVRAGATNVAGFNMFDDSAGKVTNVWVTGRGNFWQTNISGASGNFLYLENGSTVVFEHQNLYLTNADSSFTFGGIGNNTLTWRTHGRASTWTYDNCYFHAEFTNRVDAFFNEIETVGDLIETGGDAPAWGDVVIRYNHAYMRQAIASQASLMQIGGRAIVENGTLYSERTNASIYSTSAVTNGQFVGGTVFLRPNATAGFLRDNSAGTGTPFNGVTALWIKNVTIYNPTNVDAFTLTNGTLETILENVTVFTGFGSTNLVRAATPSKVRIIGSLHTIPYKPIGAGITVVGTNTSSAIYNIGTLNQDGVSAFNNDVTITASMVKIAGATQLSAESEVFANNFFITNIFYIPLHVNGTAVDARGAIHQDSNSWATGRDTIKFNDGTADVKVVAALASDTPSNGQVPVWNTDGTITWEAQSAGGSGGTNFPAVLLQAGNTNYALQSGKRTAHYMITNLNHGLDADLAVPASGQTFTDYTTNSAGTNIAKTFYTNGVVATYYESSDKTNAGTSFIIPAGSVVVSKFTWLGSYWIREEVAGPQLGVVGDNIGIALQTNGTTLTISNTFKRFGGGVTNTMLEAGYDNSGDMNFSTLSTNRWFIGGTPGTWGDFMPWNSNFNNMGSAALPVKQIYADEIYARSGGSVTRGLAVIPTLRTNFADGNISFPLYTHVAANWTNAVAGNRTITITSPVVGMSFSLSLVSDGSARTLSIFNVAGGTCTWLSTNDTANATNVLTTASKRSLICGRVDLGTDGNTTNLTLWVKNQTP